MVRVFKILKNTTAEGPGNRFCIWVQGCRKHCKGCYAKDSWDFNAGIEYSVNYLYSLIKDERNNIEGITFLGGEPLEQAKDLSILAQKVKEELNLSVVCFSGYTYEEIKSKDDSYMNKLLEYTDLLIDGGFIKDEFDLSRPWVGSKNQRYIFLSNRYNLKEILKYKNKIELHIGKNGKVDINGMGDFEEINRNFCLQLGENIVE